MADSREAADYDREQEARQDREARFSWKDGYHNPKGWECVEGDDPPEEECKDGQDGDVGVAFDDGEVYDKYDEFDDCVEYDDDDTYDDYNGYAL